MERMNQSVNATDDAETDFSTRVIYIVLPLIFMLVCMVAVMVNIKILISIRWIKRPLSPTLYISLSLALSDAWTAFMQGTIYLCTSFLPLGLGYEIQDHCQCLMIEVLRLSGILVSSFHVLALAGNHYFGILFPFYSRRWMTHSNLSIILALLWIAPTAHMFLYFSAFEGYGFLSERCLNINFMREHRFRAMFSTLFFIPTILLFIIYFHIYLTVKKHLASRRWFNRHSKKKNTSNAKSEFQQQLDGNIKAIWTSVMIISTYVICFMPVVLIFIMICTDCYFKYDNVEHWLRLLLGSTSNALLIIKPLLNPLIYSSRMQEIRIAMEKMNIECKLLCTLIYQQAAKQTNCSAEENYRLSIPSGSSRRNNIGFNEPQKGSSSIRGVRTVDNYADI